MVAAAFACAASEGLEWTAQGLQLYRAGRYAEAETMYRRALDTFDRTGEGASLDRALTLENIAVILRAQARYDGERKASSGSAAQARGVDRVPRAWRRHAR